MKQLFQSLNDGSLELVELPTPKIEPNKILIKTTCSLVSYGTEKMLIDFGKANFINKAKQQPDKLKEVISKIKTDGILQTLDTVKDKLNMPIPLGYCNVGIVIGVGENVYNLKIIIEFTY